MFFPHRIRSIAPTDRVLDIGPGSMPHPRADLYLEQRFPSEAEAHAQRGHAPNLADPARTVFYDGGTFPFADGEFDYVICSHVLEHVLDVPGFVSEIMRVGRRGYFEFPLIYYDFLYDFSEHTMFLFHRDRSIYWMPKSECGLARFRPVTRLFYESLQNGYTGLIDSLQDHLFQGFEWSPGLEVRRAQSLEELTFGAGEPEMRPFGPTPGRWSRLKTTLRHLCGRKQA